MIRDRELTDWLEDAAFGLVCNELDGYDLLPLYGMLPRMEPDLEGLLDRILFREIVRWHPPLERALARRHQHGSAARLDEAQAERVAAWSKERCRVVAERWCAVARLLLQSDGSLAAMWQNACYRADDGPPWRQVADDIRSLVESPDDGAELTVLEDRWADPFSWF